MRAELAKLLALYSDVEESCGCASLALSTSGGKSIVKFTLETPPPPVTTTSSRSPTSPSAPGNQAAGRRRRRNRGAAWRARCNQRAAASQVTLAEVNSPPASPPPRPPRPLHHLLSPSPSSGRRPWRGRRCLPSPPSTWMGHPHPHLHQHHLHHLPHRHLHLQHLHHRQCATGAALGTVIVVENAPSCVKITLAAPAVRTFHLIVQCVAAFEMLWTAHLLISNDLLFDVLIWLVLLKTQ